MDDDFGADADFLSALAASEAVASTRPRPPPPRSAQQPGRPGPAPGSTSANRVQQPVPQRIQQPLPHKVQQPIPQRLDRPPPAQQGVGGGAGGPRAQGAVKQPTPQALPQRSAGSTILVSPRQKGNPVLACLKSVAWEYSDIPADYGLGATTCALFLSLKYHRLHPEYIYTRIRNLQGRYNLRVLLTMVDIPNHEDSLRELSKTSLVNNATLILCWSAAEAARYLELYKAYEHASFAAIKGIQATSYAEKLVEFVTVPRAVNKADAVALVSTFGSLRAAINADPETIGIISGWGEKKVKAWCDAVQEPFRVKTAAKRTLSQSGSGASSGTATPATGSRRTGALDRAVPLSRVPLREMAGTPESRSQGIPGADAGDYHQKQQQAKKARLSGTAQQQSHADDEDAELAVAIEESKRMAAEEAAARALIDGVEATAGQSTSKKQPPSRSGEDDELDDGVMAALEKLRRNG
ncbi:hypothetical protein BD289DRAFT_368785 [Coniella lustricola]|uniref:ERCC1-like central domain-containing protein n=1 Tax=Coniella lustricola TaxID=2025994 RepID=A0A2T3A7K3_9PEZI|nr:hypothetical protein BD289DRAFT_368785 [Coniella lustricola]